MDNRWGSRTGISLSLFVKVLPTQSTSISEQTGGGQYATSSGRKQGPRSQHAVASHGSHFGKAGFPSCLDHAVSNPSFIFVPFQARLFASCS